MNAPEATTPPPSVQHLMDAAWQALATGPLALAPHIDRLRQLTDQPVAHALAALFEGRLKLMQGDRLACEALLKQAQAVSARFPEEHELDAACGELQALLLGRDGLWQSARDVLAPHERRLGVLRTPALRFILLARLALVHERLGAFEASLTAHYGRLGEARAMHLPLPLAQALSALGGLQSSLLNPEDALPLCQEAWALCRDAQVWANAASMAGPNLLMVLNQMGRHAEAAAIAQQLLASESGFGPHQRPARLCFYATALLGDGQWDAAQRCLDDCAAIEGADSVRRSEWAWTQAALHNQRARPQRAWALLQEHWTLGAALEQGSDYPLDTLALHQQAALACEALGDLRLALKHQRLAGQAREQALQQTAHTRRVTLQIQHKLAGLQEQHDRALREQARMSELNARLHEANQAKVRFLAAASHDLRQPLHALVLQTATLRTELTTPRQRALLDSIDRCTGTLTTMFDALLDLSRAESGVLQAQPCAVPLRPLLVALIEEHRPLAEAKGLGLALLVARRGPEHLHTDPRLLEAVLRNLLSNAIKYTETGAVLLCARLGSGPNGRAWRLQVRDSGVGIAAHEQALVFEEFYQTGNPARLRSQGRGLGLAIVQRLARLLEHPLNVRSAPGQGSCFELRVPVAVPEPAAGEPLAAPTSNGYAAPESLPRLALHVAVIEDDLDVQQALRNWLQACSCQVSMGISAADVMAQAQGKGPIDAVLADLRLPGTLDGVQEVQQLRALCQQALPALMLTGDLDPGVRARLDAAGLPWVRKPISSPQLAGWLLSQRRPSGTRS